MDTLTFKISPKYAGCRLDRYLSERFPFRSRNWWQKQISLGAITLFTLSEKELYEQKDGNLRSSTKVEASMICAVREEIFSAIRFSYNARDIEIIDQTPHYIIVNKPPGLIVHPVNTLTKGSLTCLLSQRLGQEAYLCHRLDRLTSGAMVVALSSETASKISALFRENAVKKTYLALCEGVIPWNEMTAAFPIGNDTESKVRLKMQAFPQGKNTNEKGLHPSGELKEAVTHFSVIQRLAHHTLVEAKPLTGRTHQIRVHISALGYPIIHDKLYGPVTDLAYFDSGCGNLTPYMKEWHGLHSNSISFTDPHSNVPVTYEAKLSKELSEWIYNPCRKQPHHNTPQKNTKSRTNNDV